MANITSIKDRVLKNISEWRIEETPADYGEQSDSSPAPQNPKKQYNITDEKAIYAYYQLTKAAELDDTLDRASRLKGASLVREIKTVRYEQIQKTIATGTRSNKGRAAILLNDSFAEKPQRFINCLSPSTYVCPHKHVLDNQWELMCWLTGKIEALFFDEQGVLIQRIEMSEKQNRVVEIPPNIYHSFVALEPCSYLEIRNCAYQPEQDRTYADWAAKENSKNVLQYQQRLYTAKVGQCLRME